MVVACAPAQEQPQWEVPGLKTNLRDLLVKVAVNTRYQIWIYQIPKVQICTMYICFSKTSWLECIYLAFQARSLTQNFIGVSRKVLAALVSAYEKSDAWTKSKQYIVRSVSEQGLAPALTLLRGDLTESIIIIKESVGNDEALLRKTVIAMFLMQLPKIEENHAKCSQLIYKKPWSDFHIALLHWNTSILQEGVKHRKKFDKAVKDRWLTLRKVLQNYLTMVLRILNPKVFPMLNEPTDSPAAKDLAKEWSVMYRGGLFRCHVAVQSLLVKVWNISEESDCDSDGLIEEKSEDEEIAAAVASTRSGENSPSRETEKAAQPEATGMQGTKQPSAEFQNGKLPTGVNGSVGETAQHTDQETESYASGKFQVTDAAIAGNSGIAASKDQESPIAAIQSSYPADLKISRPSMLNNVIIIRRPCAISSDELAMAASKEQVSAPASSTDQSPMSTAIKELTSNNNRFKYHRYMNITGPDNASQFVEQYMNMQCSIIEKLPESCRTAPCLKNAVLHALGLWAYKIADKTGPDGDIQTTAQERMKNIILRLSPWAHYPWTNVSLQRADLKARVSLTLQSMCQTINIWEILSQAVEPWQSAFVYILQFPNSYSNLAFLRVGSSVNHSAVFLQNSIHKQSCRC